MITEEITKKKTESYSSRVKDYLDIDSDIHFEKVKDKIEGLTKNNFETIKCRYIKEKEKKLEKITNKNVITKTYKNKKSNNYTENEVKSEFHDQDNNSGTKIKKKINMDNVEELILKQLDKSPGVPVLRLVVDFLKLKSQDHSELKEIDLDKFYKIAIDDNDPEIIGDIE